MIAIFYRLIGRVKERMPQRMLAIIKHLNALIEPIKQLAKAEGVTAADIDGIMTRKQSAIRHHLNEVKATAQRSIHQCQRAIGGSHGADDIDVRWHAKWLATVGRLNGHGVLTTGPFIDLN
ncbi:hypothetical protein D3C77_612110 [compost metagenome]